MESLFGRNPNVQESAGVPQNIFSFTDAGLAGPAVPSDLGLNSFAEDDHEEQALNAVAQVSRVDLLNPTPTQGYIHDTRRTIWATTATAGSTLTTNNVLTATLCSANCVDLPRTRVLGRLNISWPADGAVVTAPVRFSPLFWEQLFTLGLRVGSNASRIEDKGKSGDHTQLINMRHANRPWHKSLYKHTSSLVQDQSEFFRMDGGTPAEILPYTTIVADANAGSATVYFSVRPTHGLFQQNKLWAPNVPIILDLEWNSQRFSDFIDASGFAANRFTYSVAVDTIYSDELILHPTLAKHIESNFFTSPTNNINMISAARLATQGMNGPLLDFTNGLKMNPSDMAAVYQFRTSRLASFSIPNQTTFEVMPVINNSARPRYLTLRLDNAAPGAPAVTAPTGCTIANLVSLQVLYNGQTIYDRIQNPFNLYFQTRADAHAEGNGGYSYVPFVTWNTNWAFIVVDVGPSHNKDEIQPVMPSQIVIRGEFAQPTPQNAQISVGMEYDQTMVVTKNGTAIQSVPTW